MPDKYKINQLEEYYEIWKKTRFGFRRINDSQGFENRFKMIAGAVEACNFRKGRQFKIIKIVRTVKEVMVVNR